MMDIPNDLDVSLPELCKLAHFGRDGYTSMRRQGRTPNAYKIGRELRFSRSEVEEWLRTERIVPLPSKPPEIKNDKAVYIEVAFDTDEDPHDRVVTRSVMTLLATVLPFMADNVDIQERLA